MITLKTAEEIILLREAGRRLARVVQTVAKAVHPGVSTAELDSLAEKLIRDGGDTPAFLGYAPRGAKRPFPGTICISVSEEIVHGIPNENPRTIKEGEIVSLDCGLIHEGLVVDHAISVVAGKADKDAVRLMKATKEALDAGIAAARGGNHIGDIGAAIDAVAAKYGYGNVEELGGHGVGHKVHEEPYIPNFGEPGQGDELVPGLVIAIEPMLTEGDHRVKLMPDGYTFVTKDGSRASHFEHTIAITKGGAQILTVV